MILGTIHKISERGWATVRPDSGDAANDHYVGRSDWFGSTAWSTGMRVMGDSDCVGDTLRMRNVKPLAEVPVEVLAEL